MGTKPTKQPTGISEATLIGTVELRVYGTSARTTVRAELSGDPVEMARTMVMEGLRLLHDENVNIDDALAEARDTCGC